MTFCVAAPVSAQSISFPQVIQQALSRSYDLKAAAIDTRLSKNSVRAAKVPYHPVFNGSINTEYIGGLQNQNTLQSQQVAVVGNTILPGNTRFQNAVSLNANYLAADFGARANTLRAAKHHSMSSQLIEKASARDLRLQVLNAYTQALLTCKELAHKLKQQRIQSQLYEMKQRYWDAGKISRLELGEQAIALKDGEKAVAELKQQFADNLNALSAFTHETYNVATTTLDDIERPAPKAIFKAISYSSLPDFRAFEHLIQEKKAELKAIRAQRFPQLVTYGSFVLYGANQNNWISSWADLAARQFTLGIGLQLPIYDGGRNQTSQVEKRLQIERIFLQRDKRLWELRKDIERSANAVSLYGVELTTKAELVDNSKEQLAMTIRLTQSQVQEKAKALSDELDLIARQLDEEKTRIQSNAAAMRLKIYAETQDI